MSDVTESRPPILAATDVVKTFRGGDGSEVRVLDGVTLSVARGEMVAIIGASGAGKSTLLHVLGALERPTAGIVRIAGESVSALSDEALGELRNRHIGFVFQFHHLLKEFSALENVMMPMRIANRPLGEARSRAEGLLERVGLSHRLHHRPSELSGGEQQRTAVARALAMSPSLLLADEPSGNLDHHNAESLHALFGELASELALGLVVVTHNRSLASRAGRVLLLEEGHLSDTSGNMGAV
ncbi:MAG: ABC transporter ATP-binding protein [bacterium]|jgi:lipoprotein-releasing system ATP-binding protein|nr:ABC transporter ATP-binding protein [bacterium]